MAYRVKMWLAATPAIRWLQEQDPRSFRIIPPLPRFMKGWKSASPDFGAKSLDVPPIPESLRSMAGVGRESTAEEAAFREGPLYRFDALYPEIGRLHRNDSQWVSRLPTKPLRGRVQHRIDRSAAASVVKASTPSAVDVSLLSPQELTRAVRRRAAELGMSAIGIAPYDPKYIYEPYIDQKLGDRVIVCVLEMNWAATQTAPSARHERAAQQTMWWLGDLCRQLGEYLVTLGYQAPGVILTVGRGISIHYAVEAGLGQLGLNGQLLTPFAGSRCRLMLIHTDAPVVLDHPRDYGIPKICDACKACVRRCPSGAIPSQRSLHRGVYKAKIKTERCLPMIMQADGCAVCTKVCPVQRYGLSAVIDEYAASGQILGKNTDDLEGYTWGPDGRHYAPGEKPRSAVTKSFLHPEGYVHEVGRRLPPAAAAPVKGQVEM